MKKKRSPVIKTDFMLEVFGKMTGPFETKDEVKQAKQSKMDNYGV